MGLRIFYVLLVIALGAVGYQIYTLQSAYAVLDDGPKNFITFPEDADVTVVEFLDYSCTYCQQVHPTITEAVKQDGRVRYIPRPMPSRDQDATSAAIIAYTAGEQGKFMEMHNELMKYYKLEQADLEALAPRIGLDMDAYNKAFEARTAQEYLLDNSRAFFRLGNGRTPFFIINKEIFFVPEGQMPTVDDFLKMFAQARGQ